jgi:apolipoprotein N-acyltransferase
MTLFLRALGLRSLFLRSLGAFLAGTVAIGGFHPFELWFLPLLSLVMIIVIARDLGLKYRIYLCYLYGLGFLLPLLHWSSTYVGAIPWLILATGFALFYCLLAVGTLRSRASLVFFPFAFALAEGLRAIAPFGGFGWGRFGFSQLDGPLQEWLRIGGVALTGLVVALSAALLARLRRETLLVFPLLFVGMLGVVPASATTFGEPYRIGLIQGGVSQLGLDFNATPRDVFRRHFEETDRLLGRTSVDLVLWPENASDIDPLQDVEIRGQLARLTGKNQVPIVIGAVTQGEAGPENVSLFFDEDGVLQSTYQKRDLVPFGEYVPLRGLATSISSLADDVKDFVPGSEITVHETEGIRFAPLICYEILDDRVSWDNLEGSNIGVVQTNNATFGRSWQSGQQFQMTRVRAFESQMPFVVAATTGDTALISKDGLVQSRIEKFEQGSLVVEVSPSRPTPPKVAPEWILTLSALVTIGALLRRLSMRR